MPEKLSSHKSKNALPPRFLLVGLTFLLLGILQVLMFWKLQKAEDFICNGGGAWPLPSISFFGSAALTLLVVIALFVWAWKMLKGTQSARQAHILTFFWSLILAAGISHGMERITSQCVLDYWQFPFFRENVYFNGGDILLFIGAIGLIYCWQFTPAQKN